MTKVIKEVVAEVRGKSDQFAAEMAKVEARAKQTKASVEQLGAGNAAMGQRTAEAARQIASATETIARAGKVTGEAGKQIVAQASNIAFAFGPQGAIIGALGIFGIAFATTMARAREDARKAAEEIQTRLADMVNAGDVEGLKGRARTLLFGTRANNFQDGITAKQQRLEELGSLYDATLGGVVNNARAAEIRRVQAELRPLITEYERLKKVLLEWPSDPFRTNPAAPITITAGGAGKAPTPGTTGGPMAAAFAKDAESFAKDFAALLVRELGGAGDQIRAEFNTLIAAALDAGRENAVDQLIDLRDKAVAAAEAIAGAESVLQRLDLAAAQGVAPTVDTFQTLTATFDALQAQLAQLVPGTERYQAVLAEIEKIEKRRQDLLSGVGSQPGTPKATRDMADYARELQQAADGALQLAAAFGKADASAVSFLRAISQIVGNVPALMKAINAGSGLGIVSAALPIAGALASLFGGDPASAQRQEEIRANTEALERLTATVGLLGGANVSGSDASGAASGLRGFLGRANGISLLGGARQAARLSGLNLAELDRIAAEYGITLNNNIESFRQLEAALASSITKLGEFGDDLDSQRQQAAAAAKVFGITDPLALLGLTQGTYAGRSPALDQALAGIDTSTAEGRAAARQALQDLFTILQSGGASLSAAQLGGLTGDDLLQAILDLIDGLNAVDESLGTNTSTVSSPRDRTVRASEFQITADQASRLIGIETASLGELRIIRAALTASAAGVPIPALGVGFAGAGGAITVYVQQEFHGMSGREAATAVRNATIEAIDRGLGRRVLVRERHLGKAVT